MVDARPVPLVTVVSAGVIQVIGPLRSDASS